VVELSLGPVPAMLLGGFFQCPVSFFTQSQFGVKTGEYVLTARCTALYQAPWAW
jgi:hypothetical protein